MSETGKSTVQDAAEKVQETGKNVADKVQEVSMHVWLVASIMGGLTKHVR